MDGITTSINGILKNLIRNFNTLLDCPARFAGEYDGQKVHNFIEYIEYYKRVKCIGDEQALQELQYLLLDQAHSWWLRRKSNLSTWSEALSLLENQYSKKRPAHVIYMDILKRNYVDYESEDDFIEDKIELFNELCQPELKECNKLEIIYALLPNDVQNKIKLGYIRSIKDLKEQLKLIKLDCVGTSLNKDNTHLNSKITPEPNRVSTEVQRVEVSNNGPVCQESNKTISDSGTEGNADPERDPVIKVRRTEDLMPQEVKKENEPSTQQEQFIANNSESSSTRNTYTPHSNHDDFQIDSDIMNQINNIIDESEMNMNALSENQVTPTIISSPSNGVKSLEFLGFHIEATIQPEIESNNPNKSSINTTKRVRLRCSYCRKGNHTAQVCFKKAKHMKQFPERFITAKEKEKSDDLISKNNMLESLPFSTTNCTASTTSHSSTESAITTEPISSQQILTTSISYTSATTSPVTTPPVVTSTPTVILNISEKCINPTLTTKLIAPINGKTPNKILAAKLRNINTPSPKCHQCGTVGFYKSICPNCSPIYNNNHHIQYGK